MRKKTIGHNSCVWPIHILRCPWFRNSLQCWIPLSVLCIMRNLRCYLTLRGRNVFDVLSLYTRHFINLTLWGFNLWFNIVRKEIIGHKSCVCPIYISRCPWFRNSLQCWIPHSISLHNEEFEMLSNTVRKKCFWFFELIYLALYKSYIVRSLTQDSTL